MEYQPPITDISQKTQHKAFYLDDQHNIVPEDEATICVIQVLDENGNMIEEVWSARAQKEEPPPADTDFRIRYVDAQGNEVDEKEATYLVHEQYSHGVLVSSDQFLLANRKNQGDLNHSLVLEHQPGRKERTRSFIVDGHPVTLELPAYVSLKEQEYVVKNAGKWNPITGEAGDVHVQVSCKSLFYRWNTLGNILTNLFILLICVLYPIVLLIKYLFKSKLILLVLAAVAVFLALRYFYIL